MSTENVLQSSPSSSCLAIASHSLSDRAPDTDVVLVDPALNVTGPDEPESCRKSALSVHRLARWSKRYKKRLFRDVDTDTFTTDDEHSLTEILEDDSLNDFDRLKLLPRPSLIVPDIEMGSRQDAGMTAEERKIHQRRMVATTLRIQNYNRHGLPMTISESTRQHHGLEQYSAFLVPPESERSFQPRRVPKQLLSHYYRGKVLSRRFTRRRTVSSRRYDSSKPDSHPANQINNASVSEPSDYILDFDYWCPTSTYEREERARVEARKELARQAAAEEAQQKAREALGIPSQPPTKKLKSFADGDIKELLKLSNSEIVSQILEHESQSESDESQSESENNSLNDNHLQHTSPESMSSPEEFYNDMDEEPLSNSTDEGLTSGFNMPVAADSAEVPEKPEEPCELFDELFHDLQVDPQSICAPVSGEVKSEPIKHENLSCEEGDSADEQNEQTTAAEPTDLTGFEREKWLAVMYCKSLTHSKTRGSRVRKKRATHSIKKFGDKRKSTAVQPRNGNATNNFSAAWSMMKKMGFRGRLGLNEDGITEPIPLSQRMTNSKEGVGISRRLVENVVRNTPSTDLPNNSVPNDGSNQPFEEGSVFQDQENLDVQVLDSEVEKNPIQGANIAHGVGMTTDEAKNIALDSEGEYETCYESTTVDNGRRAIILDFEVLILNARERRSKAFHVLSSTSKLAQVNYEEIWKSSGRDLSDLQIIESFLNKAGITPTEKMCEKMMRMLDFGFANTKPELNVSLVKALAEYANDRNVRFTFFHRGSHGRFKREMDQLCLPDFLSDVVCILPDADEWPYVSTFSEMSFVAGVCTAQSLFILSGSNSPNVLVAGAVAGQVLGSRTVVISEDAQPNFLDLLKQKGDGSCFMIHPDDLAKSGHTILSELLQLPHVTRVRKRVLAVREEDQQFHSGTVEYGMGAEGNENELSLIKFYHNGDFEWVPNVGITSLTRRDFRALKKASFPPLLAPEDVADFAVSTQEA